MAIPKYKQKCFICKMNYVTTNYRNRFVVCYDCDKKAMEGEIKDPKMKKMFAIPEELYKMNAFLRDIKKNYIRYENLSERQIEAFKKAVKDLKKELKEKKSDKSSKDSEQ